MLRASLVAQKIKNLPAMWETQVQFLGWEDVPPDPTPTREGTGGPLQYSGLENPMDRGAWQAAAQEVSRVGHD